MNAREPSSAQMLATIAWATDDLRQYALTRRLEPAHIAARSLNPESALGNSQIVLVS